MSTPSRIVSLLPSATEIVYALGAQDRLVGVTFECDHPAAARTDHRVVVGGSDTSGMTPVEIDAQVRARAAAGEDLYTLHEGALRELDPDLVLTQDLCRVCALPSDVVGDALAHLGCTADVVALDPASLDDVLGTVLTVGAALGRSERAVEVVASLRARLDAVAAAVAAAAEAAGAAPVASAASVASGPGSAAAVASVPGRSRPRVAVLEWVDPPFAAGHWVPDLVAAAGGLEVLGRPGDRSVATTWADVVSAGPDVVVVAPCGYHLDAAAEQAEVVCRALAEAGSTDVPVWAIDADGLVVRPGPRLVDGVEALAAVLHPDAFPDPDPTAVRRVR